MPLPPPDYRPPYLCVFIQLFPPVLCPFLGEGLSLAGQPPLTQLETAQLLGISRSYVSRLESHALDLLRQNWKN